MSGKHGYKKLHILLFPWHDQQKTSWSKWIQNRWKVIQTEIVLTSLDMSHSNILDMWKLIV